MYVCMYVCMYICMYVCILLFLSYNHYERNAQIYARLVSNKRRRKGTISLFSYCFDFVKYLIFFYSANNIGKFLITICFFNFTEMITKY